MLKFIRRNASAPWVKFMFVAIVVVFIFWGMGGIVGGPKAQVVARVNHDAIEPVEFYRTYNNLLRLYQDVYKENFKPELVKGLDLKNRAVDQLIRGRLLRQEAQRIGLQVGETELRDSIVGLSVFQQDGRFTKDLYLRALRANSITPGEFEELQREELLVTKLQDLITAGVHVTDTEVRDRYDFDNEKVNLRFIKLDAADVMAEVKLTPEDVQAYFDKNRETFREPDRVRLEYVLFAPEKFEDKVALADADVKQHYDAHGAEYEKPAQVHARHILLKVPSGAGADVRAKVRQRAEEVLAKVKAGGDFAALAKQYSEDPSAAQGGDLGTFTRGKMVKPFEEAAFELAPGETSDLVESAFGFHIIKCEAKDEARTQTLDEVRPQITAKLKREQARGLAEKQADAARTKAVAGDALSAVAQADGLPVTAPAPFAQSEAIGGLGRSADFARAAFATNAGEVGAVVDTANGFVVFRLIEKLATHVPDLAEVRDRVETAVRSERAQALAKTKAEGILAELQKADLDTVAKTSDLKTDETGPFMRAGLSVPKLAAAPDLKKAAFLLTAEKPVAPAVYAVGGSSVVAVLKERLPADEEKFKSEKDTLLQQAEQQRKQQALEQFVNSLKAHATVEIGDEFLASIVDSGRALDGGGGRRR